LLKLKKLQILGFKSFCDRTELKFHGEGIAAIIGPNGCGKSNIADAISWVLGEQSAKSLRGSRMEDVIFSGTRDRNPTGMAEVSLTLIDPEVYGGLDASEPTQIDIQNDIPTGAEDWDEAELRAQASADTEEAVEEAQPGKTDEVEGVPVPLAEASEGASVGPQVVLKIRRRKFNQQQSHAGEIMVTRRLFRSGDSEYLLNGKLCRLRDIQELFMGTGLGPESYALIEQGRASDARERAFLVNAAPSLGIITLDTEGALEHIPYKSTDYVSQIGWERVLNADDSVVLHQLSCIHP